MIKLTWGQIRDGDFIDALARVYRMKLPFETTLKLMFIGKRVDEERDLSNEMASKLRKTYIEKVNIDGKDIEQVRPALKDEFLKAEREFAQHSFEINLAKIDMQALKNLELSAFELGKLSPILTEAELPT